MTRGSCSICKWFNDKAHLGLKDAFLKEVAEGRSLRDLQTWLRAYHFETSRSTLSRHLSECLNQPIKEQREVEKALRKERKGVPTRVKNLFQNTWDHLLERVPQREISLECKHEGRPLYVFNEYTDGLVYAFCPKCHKLLTKFDPEERERRMSKGTEGDYIIYCSLKRRGE